MGHEGRRAAAIGAALLWAGTASAGVSGLVEGEFARTRLDTAQPPEAARRLDTMLFTQRYRLTLDQRLFPSLRLVTGGVLEQVLGDTKGADSSLSQKARTTNLFGSLELTSQLVGAAVGYTRRESGLAGSPVSYIIEEPSLTLTLRPADLPVLSLRLSRPAAHDSARRAQDVVTSSAVFTAQYAPTQPLQLRYGLDYSNPNDRLHATETTSIAHSGGANYSRSFAPWRTTVAAGLNATARQTRVASAAGGGTVATQVQPQAALSLVEAFPAVPALDSLLPNPALNDANLTTPSAVNLGYSVRLAGDVANRDLGVQFADEITTVNTLFVWVDRQVPQELAATLSWTAYSSNDNVHWTQVPVIGPVVSSLVQNRFEITIAPTAARFVKTVVKPLAVVTTDQRLADLFVTELQVYLVSPATRSASRQDSNTELLTAGLRTQVAGWDDLAYDASLSASRSQQGAEARYTYFVANGLTYVRKLSPIFLVSARVARQDLKQARGHRGEFLYSASLSADELPTLNHSLAYTGQTSTGAAGTTTSNSVSLFNRATPYRGIGLLAGASYTVATTVTGQTNRTHSLTANATLQPHAALTLTGTYGLTGTLTTGGAEPAPRTRAQHVEGTASFNPFPALYASGGVQRTVTDGKGYTFGNVALGVSPFQGGALQLTFSYNQTLDSNGAVTRLVAPGLRWNIDRSTVLTATYVLADSEGETEVTRARTFDVNLRIPL